MPLTKPCGIRLERKKEPSLLNTLKRPFAVKGIRVPLCGGSRTGFTLCIKEGERVQPGQKIAYPKSPDGVPVYAGISGEVEKVAQTLLPEGNERLSVWIASDPANKFGAPADKPWQAPLTGAPKDAEHIPADELLRIFREQGLLVADGKMEPVHSRIRKKAPVQTVVINGCEPEPYVTSQQVLTTLHPVEILKGAGLLKKACGAGKIIFVFEDANREEYELIKSKIYLLKWNFCEAVMIPAVYPAGREETLSKVVPGETVVWSATTAYAVYEAVYLQKPFFERIVTVGGECVVEPRNLWLPFGFLFRDAVQACKGLLREPRKVIAGGPMTGFTQPHLDIPVTAGTSAILALPGEIARATDEKPCIRCNRCVDVCPVSISPAMITLAVERDEFDLAKEWGAEACIECGACGYVCPSERPMTELILLALKKTGGRK